MRLPILSALALSGALFAAGGAQAGTIYNGGTPNDPDSFYFADPVIPYAAAADSFTLSAGGTDIKGVHWWGGCYPTAACPTGALTLSIYNNASGEPGTLIHSYNVGNADQTYVATGTSGLNEYSYAANIPGSGLSLTAGTEYWLGISNSVSSTVWGWDTTLNAPVMDHDGMQLLSGTWVSSTGNDFAFNLTSTDAVPEPFTLSLFGAGLAGAAALRRRKKKA